MNTDRTIILTMLANQQINADEAERLLILTEALHRIERTPHPPPHHRPLMSQLFGDYGEERPEDDRPNLDYLTDPNDLVDFETFMGIDGIEDFFSLPDLPPFPEMIDFEAFVHMPDDMTIDRDSMVNQFRDLHERLDHMKEQFADFKGKFVEWQDEVGFDSEML